MNIYLNNIYSINRNIPRENNISRRYLPNFNSHDIIEIKDSNKGKTVENPKLYKLINKSYAANADKEKDFSSALHKYATSTTAPDENTVEALDNAYTKLVSEILSTEGKDSEDKKLFLFCSLTEALDNAKIFETAEKLNYYLFDDFMNLFGSSETIQNAKTIYATSDILKRDIIKMGFKN